MYIHMEHSSIWIHDVYRVYYVWSANAPSDQKKMSTFLQVRTGLPNHEKRLHRVCRQTPPGFPSRWDWSSDCPKILLCCVYSMHPCMHVRVFSYSFPWPSVCAPSVPAFTDWYLLVNVDHDSTPWFAEPILDSSASHKLRKHSLKCPR